jgi:hypothetical protein
MPESAVSSASSAESRSALTASWQGLRCSGQGFPLPAVVKQHPSDWQITGFQRRKARPMAALPRAAAAGRALLPRRPRRWLKIAPQPRESGECRDMRSGQRSKPGSACSAPVAHQPFLGKKRRGGNRAFWLWLRLHCRRERWAALDHNCIACQRSQPAEPPRGGHAHRRPGDGP